MTKQSQAKVNMPSLSFFAQAVRDAPGTLVHCSAWLAPSSRYSAQRTVLGIWAIRSKRGR